MDLECSVHIVTILTGVSHSNRSFIWSGFFLDLICANPEVVPKYYAPRPASPVHRLRRFLAGRAGCIIKCCPLDCRTSIHWNVVMAIFQHNHICKIVGKIPDQHLNVWLFSNPGDKIQKRWRTMGQICPVLSTRIWTLSSWLENNHTLKCWSGIFPTILTYMIMLKNCKNNISVYGCSPIQGTQFYSCWNLMKPGSQSGT